MALSSSPRIGFNAKEVFPDDVPRCSPTRAGNAVKGSRVPALCARM